MEKEIKTALLKLIEYEFIKKALIFKQANIPTDAEIKYEHFN